MERLELEAALRLAVERDRASRPLPAADRAERLDRRALGSRPRSTGSIPDRGLLGPEEFMPVAEATGSAAAIGDSCSSMRCTSSLTGAGQARRCGCRSACRRASSRTPASIGRSATRSTPAASTPARCAWRSPRAPSARTPRRSPRRFARSRRPACGSRSATSDRAPRSFSRLRQLPIDALKIHRASSAHSASPTRTRRSSARWSSSATRSGSSVVADGVETEAQLESLRELGCDAAQGDLIGPPATEEQTRRAAGRRGRVARPPAERVITLAA